MSVLLPIGRLCGGLSVIDCALGMLSSPATLISLEVTGTGRNVQSAAVAGSGVLIAHQATPSDDRRRASGGMVDLPACTSANYLTFRTLGTHSGRPSRPHV